MSLKTRNFEKSAGGCAGLAATAILKHDPATASIPLIAFGALAMKAGEELSQSAGWKAGLVKPLRYKELYAVMERLLVEPEPADKQATPPTWSPT
jgi:CheY-like chemotaxis protein